MDPPNTEWQRIILSPDIISEIDDNLEICIDDLSDWAEKNFSEILDAESPEFVALQIGQHAQDFHPENFRSILRNDIDNYEARELAKGYIGAQAMESV